MTTFEGVKTILHSCGYIAPLLPGLIEAGLDCLEAMEVKAGMDMPLYRLSLLVRSRPVLGLLLCFMRRRRQNQLHSDKVL